MCINEIMSVKRFLELMGGKPFNLTHWDWANSPSGYSFSFDNTASGELVIKLEGASEGEVLLPQVSGHAPKIRCYDNRIIHLFFPANMANWPRLETETDEALALHSREGITSLHEEQHEHSIVFTFLRALDPLRTRGWQFSFIVTDDMGPTILNHSGHGGGGRN